MEWTDTPPDQGNPSRRWGGKSEDPRVVRRRERQEKVKELAELGLTPRQIAPKIGCSYSVVVTDFHDLGFETHNKKQAMMLRRVQVKEMWERGLGALDIAKDLRVGVTTIQNDLRALGLSKDRRRGSHQHQASVIEDVMSMLRAAAATLEQYDFETVKGDEEWLPDAQGLKRWRRDLNAFHKQMRRVQNMITETQKERMQ